MMFGLKKNHQGDRKLRLIDSDAPFAFVEAYKSLRTNVDFICSSNNYHSILVTSAGSWDGKSTVAINLSKALADNGKRVVLVDCDMRKASLSSYLKIARNADGITSVLATTKKLPEVIVWEEALGLYVLPVGRVPSNPAEVVGSERMIQLLRALEERFEYVIIDTPPVSVVTDAAILSRFVDGVILVARADETTKQALNLSKKNLEDVNAHILGVVLNDYNAKKHAYGKGYYYSSYYRYSKYGYYGYGKERKKRSRKKKSSDSEEQQTEG